MSTLLAVILYGVCGLWACFALARLQAAWDASQQRTSELRQALSAAAAKLLRDMETVQKLNAETERVKEGAAAAAREQKERHETLARSTPPPAEIHVISEYPASRRDAAWVVDFVRDTDAPRQPWEREPKTSLIWAPSQSSALDRARQLTRAYKTYTVAGARPLQ